MEARFVNPVRNSMVNVLSTVARLEPRPGTPSLKTDDRANGVVTGIIFMEGDRARGSLAITFTEPVILELVKRMLRREIDEVDDMAKDLTGEIANMVLGGAKAALEEDGYRFGMKLPKVLAGDDYIIDHPVRGPKILLPFTTDCGELYVEICFQE